MPVAQDEIYVAQVEMPVAQVEISVTQFEIPVTQVEIPVAQVDMDLFHDICLKPGDETTKNDRSGQKFSFPTHTTSLAADHGDEIGFTDQCFIQRQQPIKRHDAIMNHSKNCQWANQWLVLQLSADRWHQHIGR